MKKTLLMTLTIIFFVSLITYAEDDFNAVFEIDFFNRINNQNSLNTEAFQRYHKLAVNYQWQQNDIGLIYNWFDSVKSEVSTHTVTPWVLNYTKKLDNNSSIRLTGITVTDLESDNSTNTLAAAWLKTYIYKKYKINTELGLKTVDGKLFPVAGVKAEKDNFSLAVNCLDMMDTKLMEDNDGQINIPITLAYIKELNEFNSMTFSINHLLTEPEVGQRTWMKAAMKFDLY